MSKCLIPKCLGMLSGNQSLVDLTLGFYVLSLSGCTAENAREEQAGAQKLSQMMQGVGCLAGDQAALTARLALSGRNDA